MNDNKIMIAIFAFICLVLIYRKYNSTRIEPNPSYQAVTQTTPSASSNHTFPSAADVQKQALAQKPEEPAAPVASLSTVFAELDKKSAITVQDFKELAHLQLYLPPIFRFTKIDMSIDNVEGIFGITGDATQGLAILASNLPANLETVRKYLDDASTDVPNLKGKRVRWGATTQSFPPTAGSGLVNTIVWHGTNGTQEVFAAAYMDRIDKKGRYIFIFSSKNTNALHNDGYFESLLSQVKAQ